MIRKRRYILIGGVVLVCLVIMIPYACSRDWTFRGKVIDYDTKEPIEGAVVVAEWLEARATIAGESTRYRDVKETLTDKNGEWVIVGPKGRRYDPVPFWSFITGIHYTLHPGFIIFKPGYEVSSFMSHTRVSFTARVYVDKKYNLEGIVLTLREIEDEYIRRIDKEIPEKRIPYRVPFIPMKDPERRLRNLEIPFDYDPDQVMRISTKVGHQFKTYTVLGLRKLNTTEERLRALPGKVARGGAEEKQRNFIRLINEERRNLGLPEYRYFKE